MPHARGRTDLPVLLLHNLDLTWPPAEVDRAVREVDELTKALRQVGHPVVVVPVSHVDLAACLRGYCPDDYIVFNWCEGLPGVPRSEALVAQMLSEMGYTYTGSTPATLALSWDKGAVKRLLDWHGLPTPRWRFYTSPLVHDWGCFPAIVKPAYEHCSLGVTPEAVVLTLGELERRVAYVLNTFQQPAMVEDFVDGREFHVTVWGNGAVQVLPPAEMDFSAFEDVRDRLCTYDSKFTSGSRHYENIEVHIPASLEQAEYVRLEHAALVAYDLLGCRDYARLDLRLWEETFYLLDVNPNPDMSAETSMAEAAAAAGYSYGDMGSYLVNLAAMRHPACSQRVA